MTKPLIKKKNGTPKYPNFEKKLSSEVSSGIPGL
jgi:hypothetical protein